MRCNRSGDEIPTYGSGTVMPAELVALCALLQGIVRGRERAIFGIVAIVHLAFVSPKGEYAPPRSQSLEASGHGRYRS